MKRQKKKKQQETGNRQPATGNWGPRSAATIIARCPLPVACLLLLLVGWSSRAHAQSSGGIVVLTFTGDNAAASRNAVVDRLRSRLDLIARDRFEEARGRLLHEADPDVAACRELGGRAIVGGETVRERAGKVLRTRVRSCRTGRPIGEQAIPWRGRTLAPASLEDAIDAIVSAVESESSAGAAPPPIESGPVGPPPETGPPPEAPSAPAGEGWLELALTAGVGSRSLSVEIDPRFEEGLPGSTCLVAERTCPTTLVYEGGAYGDGGIEVVVYPMRLAQSEPRGLGIRARFLQALSVKSTPRAADEQAPGTTVQNWVAEAFYRIPFGDEAFAPAIRLGIGYERFAFVLEDNAHLPTFIYESIRPAVALYLPISGPDIAFEAGAAYKIVTGPGSVADDGLGPGTATGYDFFAGIRGDTSGGFFWGAVGEYLPFILEFQADPCEGDLHCAGVGDDSYLRARVFLGYRFE